MIRPCTPSDFIAVWEIINDAARAYADVIPSDCYHQPYMPQEELQNALDQGVQFWGFQQDEKLVGVMGLQDVQDVTLIRHAYVRTASRNAGIGGQLLTFLRQQTSRPILIGTWADATWAIRFYQKHGFRQVPQSTKSALLRKYWGVSQRQIQTSVVLADENWFATHSPS